MSQERELGWDDEIVKEGGGFTLLPEGDYNFTVTKMERARFSGSAKMPACNQAKLELAIQSAEHGEVTVFHNLFLHTKTEGLLSNFFIGIGQKREGEPLRMNWGQVVGASGRLKLEINKYKSNSGEDKTNNQVKEFYKPEVAQGYQAPQQQQYQQPAQQPQQTYQQPQQPVQQNQAPFPTAGQTQPQQGGYTQGQF
ncbi:hypothetical protein [Sporosarcina sp. SAFN-010]|uniref:hypothetical protein n=1 Tax=Sporosarcina sp. SAFN-010 TaxID=3387273 RepID=UPI003F81FB0F